MEVVKIILLYAVLKMANFQLNFVGPVNSWPDLNSCTLQMKRRFTSPFFLQVKQAEHLAC